MWARVTVSGVEFNKDFGEALKRLTNMGKRDFLLGKRTFFLPKSVERTARLGIYIMYQKRKDILFKDVGK